jgi:hypothetical protein
MSETEYLSREVDEAREALKRSVADLKSNAKASLDLSTWARAYPWPAVGAAAIAGFALAATLGSRSKSTAKPSSAPTVDPTTPTSAPAPAAAFDELPPSATEPKPTFFASISPALFDLAKLLIETVIMSAIRSAQASGTHPPANQDGPPTEDSPQH